MKNQQTKLSFNKVVKIILSPVLNKISSYFLNQLRSEFTELTKAQEIFTNSRFEQIKEVQFKLSEQQQLINELLRNHINFSSEKVSNTLISNGLIDSKSYLQKALEDKEFTLEYLKNKYGEDGWYYLFEKLFRGSEKQIYERQSFYLNYISETYAKIKKTNSFFLDFGSGRSEFLQLLKNNEIPAKGVDSNKLNTELAQKKDLSVIHDDGLNYLKSIPDNSLYGITMFQVAEHIPYDALKEIISLSYKKILPGGIFLIETVNPSCDFAMRYFYLDPTHIRPYPPETLKFSCEWEGFKDCSIIFYEPDKQHHRSGDFTNYIGYALLGYK